MTNVFSRSWSITKLSFDVLMKDKEMLLFPLLSGLFSLLFVVAMAFPSGVVALVSGQGAAIDVVGYVLMAATYFGLAFVSTFFNVCVVYTTKVRFEGGDATFMDSIRFAMSRAAQIAGWSLLSASVGILLHLLDKLAERMGGAGRLVVGLVRGVLGMAWSVISLFVVPVMVFEGVGPQGAIRGSAETLKKTWGESLVRHFGLGLMQFLALCTGGVLAFGLIQGGVALGGAAIWVAVLLIVVYFLGIVLVFQVLNSVFNTALYVYARQGQAPAGFDGQLLQSAFRLR